MQPNRQQAESTGKVRALRGPGAATVPVALGRGVSIGGDFVVMAGPCAVEDAGQMREATEAVAAAGCPVLRGGAFKPRSSPRSFQGLGESGLELLTQSAARSGLASVSEIVDAGDLPLFEQVEMLQVGARNMQNFALLKALAKSGRPVLLKRGFANTLDEWLLAADYLLDGGNERVVLCERGIRTFETATRSTLDLSAVILAKQRTHLPVVVDPSHAAGRSDLVIPLSLAAAACGADGLLVEVHPRPEVALCDGAQALHPAQLNELMQRLPAILAAVGRKLWQPSLPKKAALR